MRHEGRPMPERAQHHPHPDRLRAFDQGRLGPVEWTAIERHLLDCAACAAQIQQLPEQRLVDLLGEYDPENTGGGTPPRPAPPPPPAPPPLPRAAEAAPPIPSPPPR